MNKHKDPVTQIVTYLLRDDRPRISWASLIVIYLIGVVFALLLLAPLAMLAGWIVEVLLAGVIAGVLVLGSILVFLAACIVEMLRRIVRRRPKRPPFS